MKKTAINIFIFVFAALVMAVNANGVQAAPRLTLSPVSGDYTKDSNFTVSIGVNSETEKSSAVDVWATFDATKLEVVSIVKSANPPFDFEMTPTIDNTLGKFNFSCASTNLNSFEDAAINGELAVVTFKAKEVGTGVLNFTCVAGSTTDSNIFNSSFNDVISCGANSAGSYTITASSSTTSTTPTPTTTTTTASSTSTTSTTTTTSTELPQTGGIASTVGLIVFGVISLASALFLKFL